MPVLPHRRLYTAAPVDQPANVAPPPRYLRDVHGPKSCGTIVRVHAVDQLGRPDPGSRTPEDCVPFDPKDVAAATEPDRMDVAVEKAFREAPRLTSSGSCCVKRRARAASARCLVSAQQVVVPKAQVAKTFRQPPMCVTQKWPSTLARTLRLMAPKPRRVSVWCASRRFQALGQASASVVGANRPTNGALGSRSSRSRGSDRHGMPD